MVSVGTFNGYLVLARFILPRVCKAVVEEASSARRLWRNFQCKVEFASCSRQGSCGGSLECKAVVEGGAYPLVVRLEGSGVLTTSRCHLVCSRVLVVHRRGDTSLLLAPLLCSRVLVVLTLSLPPCVLQGAGGANTFVERVQVVLNNYVGSGWLPRSLDQAGFQV